jgi:hypothetical protein
MACWWARSSGCAETEAEKILKAMRPLAMMWKKLRGTAPGFHQHDRNIDRNYPCVALGTSVGVAVVVGVGKDDNQMDYLKEWSWYPVGVG